MMVSATCQHQDLHFELNHHHFGDTNVHSLDITAKCNLCGVRMRFRGMPFGVSMAGPAMDCDGLKARIPIVAENEEPDSELSAILRKQPLEGGMA